MAQAAPAKRRSYDPRLRNLVCAARDPKLFPDLVPSGTGRTWMSRGPLDIVGNDNALYDVVELHRENARLRRKLAISRAVNILLLALVRVFALRGRLPQSAGKRTLIAAINGACNP